MTEYYGPSFNSLRSGYTLVVTEKPDAARRIAAALGKFSKLEKERVEYYDVVSAFDGKRYLVCSAAGHLYGLADPEKNRGIYPVLDVEWFPLSSISMSRKRSARAMGKRTGQEGFYVSRRIHAISNLARNANSFVQACDYDIEGETIGFNILEFACGMKSQTNVLRARFSTLTEGEIRSAFSNLEIMDRKLATAGRARHVIDFLWGVNFSRALTEAVSSLSGYRMITIGRVQGPTLAFVVDREISILTHVPVPYWSLVSKLEKDGVEFSARYIDPRIEEKNRAEEIYSAVSKEESAEVNSVTKSKRFQPPPYPFNLGDLQKEAFRIYKLSPSVVLAAAEKLYLKALISYPRTDSQKLPPSIGYPDIIDGLAKNRSYARLVADLRREVGDRLVPRQGPSNDPAHPAIYPTGESSGADNLDHAPSLVYDLVARRFLSAFARNAIFEESEALLDIAGYKFVSSGSNLISSGWTGFYPYYKMGSENKLPELRESEGVKVLAVELSEKREERPSRYSQGSLLSKMESEGIGTKATRAETISTLFMRGYLDQSEGVKPTEVGMNLVEAMRLYCPTIISPKMTEQVEEEIDRIAKGENSEVSILAATTQSLCDVLTQLMEREKDLGAILNQIGPTSARKSETRERTKRAARSAPQSVEIGNCPVCKKGKLIAIRSFKTGKRFLGCSAYRSGCRASAPLPGRGSIKSANANCPSCGWPEILVIFTDRGRARSPWKLCPNAGCNTKRTRGASNDSISKDISG